MFWITFYITELWRKKAYTVLRGAGEEEHVILLFQV